LGMFPAVFIGNLEQVHAFRNPNVDFNGAHLPVGLPENFLPTQVGDPYLQVVGW
jgi:hypothetical protein